MIFLIFVECLEDNDSGLLCMQHTSKQFRISHPSNLATTSLQISGILIKSSFGCANMSTQPPWTKKCYVTTSLTDSVYIVTSSKPRYGDVIMGTMASQITSLTIVYSIVYSGADQRKHQSSASLAFVRGILPGPLNSPLKCPVTRKMFPFDDVILEWRIYMDSWTKSPLV